MIIYNTFVKYMNFIMTIIIGLEVKLERLFALMIITFSLDDIIFCVENGLSKKTYWVVWLLCRGWRIKDSPRLIYHHGLKVRHAKAKKN